MAKTKEEIVIDVRKSAQRLTKIRNRFVAHVRNLVTLPGYAREFILVRKIVVNLAVKCFLKRVSQPLSKMFGRSRQNQRSFFVVLPAQYLREWIIFGSSGSLIA